VVEDVVGSGGYILSRDEGVLAAVDHFLGQATTHDGLGLEVEVLEHFIRAPAANEANAIRVNKGAEKGHGPARA
jgi:hypothetical protein